MDINLIDSKHVFTRTTLINFSVGIRHYRLGFEFDIGIQHKIFIRLMLLKWHLCIHVFKMSDK